MHAPELLLWALIISSAVKFPLYILHEINMKVSWDTVYLNLCFDVCCFGVVSVIFPHVTSLLQSYNCPSANEATLKNMGW